MNDLEKVINSMPVKSTIRDYLYRVVDRYHDWGLIKTNSNHEIMEKSYAEFINETERLGAKLNCTRKHIGIIGMASYEWLVTYFACVNTANVIVPIDYNLSAENISKLLKKAEVSIVFYDEKYAPMIKYIKTKNDDIDFMVCLSELSQFTMGTDINNCTKFVPVEDDVAMIAFTSGTTGPNKGVMLTHKNLIDNVICSVYLIGYDAFKAGETTVCILPLYHMLGVTTAILCPLFYGLTICLLGDENDIIKNFKLFKPIYIVGVPMVAEGILKFVKSMSKKLNKEEEIKEFFIDTFGGNLKTYISGGAPIEDKVINEYESLGIILLNGYGITECSPVVSCNRISQRKRGSVGLVAPKPYCEVKIHNDEVYIRGSIVTKGYYNDDEGANNIFDGEWLKTGDLGHLDKDNYLYITGRKKNVIILKDGNNVSPEEIEKLIMQSPLVSNILVKSETVNNIDLIVAYVYPDYQYAKDTGIVDIQKEMDDIVDTVNREIPRYMQVQLINLQDKDFEVTALGKVKRYKYI